MTKKEPKKLRFSFSIANAWLKNDLDGAVAMYKHEEYLKTEAQQKGIDFHKKMELEIKANNKIRVGNTSFEFDKPECEKKVYVPYNEFVLLSAVFDCIDGDTLYEWKTGTTSAFEYATGLQIPFYFFTLETMKHHVKRAHLLHYDFKKASLVTVTNSKKKIAEGENLVQSISMEIYDYFNKLNIL